MNSYLLSNCISYKLFFLAIKKIPLKDLIKENKRVISRAIRELDRERTRMEREEKKLIADIKKMANQGQMKAVNIQAKELVRTKNYITKFLQMRAHLNAVLLKIQTVKSHEAVSLPPPLLLISYLF